MTFSGLSHCDIQPHLEVSIELRQLVHWLTAKGAYTCLGIVLIEITTSGSIVRTGDLLAVRGDIVTEEIMDEVHIEYS